MAEGQNQDQRTEDPTPRRLERALEEGQIAFSSELIAGLMLVVGVIFFYIWGRWFFDVLRTVIRERLTFIEPMIEHPETILLGMRRDLMQAGTACFAILIPVVVVVLVASLLQTRFNITTKPLELKWERLNPTSGIKRIFSSRSVVRGAVALVKVACIGVVATWLTLSRWDQISGAGQTSLAGAVGLGAEILLVIALTTAILMTLVGAADYGFQWWKQRRELRMSLQEIRDENKETEGDPMIKARIRRIANEVTKKRMMQAIPTASVVVTNPTHYAVALRYDPEESPAPIVVAKGTDYLAQQIIAAAKQHGVAVVERKPVARFLYANVKIGQQIPLEMYQAVAEILNFIRSLQKSA